MRQPSRVCGEFSARETLSLPASPVFLREQPSDAWLTVSHTTALRAPHSSSFHTKPVELSMLMAVYYEKAIARVIDDHGNWYTRLTIWGPCTW